MNGGIQNKDNNVISFAISILLSTIIITYFLFSSENIVHWYVIPVYISGIIIGIDMINWFRGKMDTFDPIGYLGIFGYHFFFIAPLLYVYWNNEMKYVIPPDDWRVWLGGMAIINLIGLVIYRLTRKTFIKRFEKIEYSRKWMLNKRKLFFISVPLLFIMLALQLYVYMQFGGISGYISSYTERTGEFSGLGFIFMIAESFPIILLILFIAFFQDSKINKSVIIIVLIFIAFLALKIFFGGLRGSRSNTLWGIIWGAGIIHFFLREISRKTIILGSIFMFAFIFVYGIYKGTGEGVLSAFESKESYEDIVEDSGRGISTVLLGDLSRSGVQAFILYRLAESPDEYTLAMGRSYIGDLSILIPKRIYPSRPPTKVKEGTDIIHGDGAFERYDYVSSRIYGLTGEFMLNFGYYFASITFVILAILIAFVHSLCYNLPSNDSRYLLYPFLVIVCFLLLVQDLDNLVFGVVKNLAIPFIVVYLSSEKVKR